MPPVSQYRPSSGSGSSLPPLVGQAVELARQLLFDRRYFWVLVGLLTLFEAALGTLIIWKVPYTKIDWPAYMQQVDGFLGGERDYSKLEGDTGPLVYPALHLYIYTTLQKLLPVDSEAQVRGAQYVFLALYLLTFLLVSTIYFLAGRRSARSYPQALLVPLVLSKRLHSIFLLRLFNDPVGMVLLYASVLFYMLGGLWGALGSIFYSLALGVKMNILLFLPGLLVILFQYRGLGGMLESSSVILAIQASTLVPRRDFLLLPIPFCSWSDPSLTKSYFFSAFDLSRQFLYKWTVNWRFTDERTFLSKEFANLLLAIHLGLLVVFALFKWLPSAGTGSSFQTIKRGLLHPLQAPFSPTSYPSNHVPLVLFTANLIGITAARSLHYQFHSWYFHQIPFLLASGAAWDSPILGVALWVMVEYGWATFPSTYLSSGLLLAAHVIMLAGLLVKSGAGSVSVPSLSGKKLKKK